MKLTSEQVDVALAKALPLVDRGDGVLVPDRRPKQNPKIDPGESWNEDIMKDLLAHLRRAKP